MLSGKLNDAMQPARGILQPAAYRRYCRGVQEFGYPVMPARLFIGALRVRFGSGNISRIRKN